MKEKQQQLLFDKGITNVPSDALCSDNALEESLGMVYDNGEHRVIQKPKQFMAPDTGVQSIPTILYVHKYNDETRYVVFDNHEVKWGTNNNGTYEPATETVEIHQGDTVIIITRDVVLWTVEGDETPNVTSIGKTLIISDNEGLHYVLWKADEYKFIGNNIPIPEVEFALSKQTSGGDVSIFSNDTTIDWEVYNDNSQSSVDIISFGPDSATIADQTKYNDLIIGLYSKNKKNISEKKAFCLPFFVRTAVELYDGSYTHISQPILMLPSISTNTHFYAIDNDNVRLRTAYSYLYFRSKFDYTDWVDIVKGVVVFVSAPIEINELLGDLPAPVRLRDIRSDGIAAFDYLSTLKVFYEGGGGEFKFLPFSKREGLEINNDITSTSIFYKLSEIGLKGTDYNVHQGWEPMADKFGKHVLENITTQEMLENDDYFSRNRLKADILYPYNSRLNLAGVSRGFYEGYDDFMPFVITYDGSENPEADYKFYVTIQTDGGDITVLHTATTNQIQGIWFYYPDARAKHVLINKTIYFGGYPSVSTVLDADLKEHPRLNGAYYFGGISPSMVEPTTTWVDDSGIVTNNDKMERLPNYIVQSEVNNPFVFIAAGYFKVGTGKIVGMSTITQALSEGQFGQFPLLVFSESGVWALTVASTGYYNSIHPISREVSLDPACIIQTDGAVFFTSAKGLMVVVGNNVKCVSEQLSGKMSAPFVDYLKTAFIAYDYRDSLLWIFDGASHTENNETTVGSTKCWVYSIKSGTFGRYDFGLAANIIKTAVNNYPDYLLQDSTKVYSLMERPNINNDSPSTYGTTILTRPMKLENALALKSIMQVKHIHDMNANAALALRIFASNNLKNWVELHSLRGTPWKYYRFRYDFTGLKATDRFAGTMLITQERRTDKLR